MGDISSGEVVGLEWIGVEVDTGLYGSDPVIDNQTNRNAAESHSDELSERDGRASKFGAEPCAEEVDHHHDDGKTGDKGDSEDGVNEKLRHHKLD